MKRVAVVLLVAASVAHADPDPAHAAADQGAALFRTNDFAGAVAKFKEAYGLNHDPSYLFNIAQAYRHAGDCVSAADYYGRFLAEVPEPPNADKIRVWYASQMECAKLKTKLVPEPASPPAPNPPPPNPPAIDRPVRHGHGSRTAAFVLGATGFVGLGVGGFFAWDAHHIANERASFLAPCTTAAPCSSAVVDDYDRRGHRANTLAIVGFAASGIALTAGAAIYLLSRSETAPVAIAPVPGGAVVVHATAW